MIASLIRAARRRLRRHGDPTPHRWAGRPWPHHPDHPSHLPPWFADPLQRRFDRRLHRRLDRRLHRRLHRRLRHSLGARLTLIFLLLAAAGCVGVYLAAQHQAGWGWVLLGLPLLTLMAYGSIRHMLRPLRALAHGAAMFGRGELSHRIVVHHHDEIGALARRFNRMADDIQAMLDAKRELLLAISHELRSPLTRARLNAELIDDTGPSHLALLGELGLMRDLIEDLLERERLDSGHGALRLQPVAPRAVIEDLLASRFAQAVSAGLIAARWDDTLPATMPLDRTRIQLLIGNLLDNALRHNDAAQGPVQLHATLDGQALCIRVRDHGPGVPEEALAQLGQPFFRPDAARTRDSGGVGLGLNLCRLVAQAHGGQLVLRNAKPGPGFEATASLPLP